MSSSTSWIFKPGWGPGPAFDLAANPRMLKNRKILEVRVLSPHWDTVPLKPQEHSHRLVEAEGFHLYLELPRWMYFLW